MTSVEHFEDSAEHEAREGEVVKGGEGSPEVNDEMHVVVSDARGILKALSDCNYFASRVPSRISSEARLMTSWPAAI
jgi:hypothetical protein